MHRPGSPLCEVNPLSALRLATRYGAEDSDLLRCGAYITEQHPHAAGKVRELLNSWGIYEALPVDN